MLASGGRRTYRVAVKNRFDPVIPKLRARCGRSGVQGQAFLVTFAAMGKSDRPRAAMERARGKRLAPFSRPFDKLSANGGVTSSPQPSYSS